MPADPRSLNDGDPSYVAVQELPAELDVPLDEHRPAVATLNDRRVDSGSSPA